MTDLEWRIEWDAGRAAVQALGGMLGPLALTLPDGREVEPLALGDWSEAEGPAYDALPPMIRGLRGEWPCVPFGLDRPRALPPAWHPLPSPAVDPWTHGFGSHHEWTLMDRGTDTVTIAIHYPGDHPVRRLQRTVRGIPGRPAIAIDLEVEMRKDFDLCLALHPVFRLPETAGGMEIVIEGAGEGRTYPLVPDPTSRVVPDASFATLAAVPAPGAATVDFSHLPSESPSEDLLQVVASAGRVVLRNHAERYAAALEYDPGLFPTIMLWIANGGLAGYPWNGRFRALGVEPCRAAFDLGPAVSASPANPWRKAGLPTTIPLAAGDRLATRYAISVEAL
jgi:hypothetical protein